MLCENLVNARASNAARDRQHQLRRVRGGERRHRPTPPTTRPISRRSPKGSRSSSPPATKARPAAMPTPRPQPTASASAASPPRPTTSPSAARTSATPTPGPTPPTGTQPTPRPTARPRSYIPEIPWNDSCASALIASYVSGSGITYGSERLLQQPRPARHDFLRHRVRQRRPERLRHRQPSTAGVVSGTCKGYAKPSWQSGVSASRATACATFPTSRCSPPTASGATTTCSATPTRAMAATRLHRRAQHLDRRGRHLLRVAHHGRHPGAGQPEVREPPGQSEPHLLQDRRRRIRHDRQRHLQLQQRQGAAGSAACSTT